MKGLRVSLALFLCAVFFFACTFDTLVLAETNDIDDDITVFQKSPEMLIELINAVDSTYEDDEYGGKYIDSAGNLVVLISESNSETVLFKEKVTNVYARNSVEENDSAVVYADAVFSLGQLKDAIDLVMEHFGSKVLFAYTSEAKNKIIICPSSLYTDSTEKFIEEVSLLLPEEMFEVELSEGGSVETTKDVTVGSGFALEEGYSICCAAKYNGKNGWLTAGHANSVGDEMTYAGNGKKIGTIKKCHFGDEYDYAFIEAENISGFLGIGAITWKGSTLFQTPISYRCSPTEGLPIAFLGQRSTSSGTIQSASISGTATDKSTNTKVAYSDMVMASYESTYGDSGGFVYYRSTFSNSTLPESSCVMGIQSSTNFTASGDWVFSVFSKIEHVEDVGITILKSF